MDETLERKEAQELEESFLSSMKALSTEENKKKLAKYARLATLVGKISEKIP